MLEKELNVDWMRLTPLRQWEENPHESQAHFFLLFVKLYDGSGKQGDKIPLLDFRIHQVDGYRDGTFYA